MPRHFYNSLALIIVALAVAYAMLNPDVVEVPAMFITGMMGGS